MDVSEGLYEPAYYYVKSNRYLQDFIELYESMPELWNCRREDYRNKIKRNNALIKLLNCYKQMMPHATIEDVKKKINTLRSNYRKELHKIHKSKNSGIDMDEVYTPTSWTFYALQFLGECEKPLLPNELQNQDQDTIDEESVLQLQDNPDSEVSHNHQLTSTIPLRPFQRKKRKKTIDPIARQNELLSLACAFLSKPLEKSSQDDDSLDVAKVWAKKLKKLNPEQRLLAEKAINDVLFEAQLSALTNNSVKINERNSAESPGESSTFGTQLGALQRNCVKINVTNHSESPSESSTNTSASNHSHQKFSNRTNLSQEAVDSQKQ